MRREAPTFGTTVTIVAWVDPVVDSVGHDPRSRYVERFWLPVLGPTTVWLLRRLADELDAHPDGAVLELATLARELGLQDTLSRGAPFVRSFTRAVQFGVADAFGDALAVRRRLPYVPARHVAKFPARLRDAHAAFLLNEEVHTESYQRQRAYGLALTLARLGEGPDQVMTQLSEWRFPPDVALAAATWALERARRDETEPAA
jgi:hypothetical protein